MKQLIGAYGYLPVSGDSFDKVGILARTSNENNNGRSNAENTSLTANPKWIIEAETFFDNVSGNATYEYGEYLFLAYVQTDGESKYGYPIEFNIINHNEVIVDNDQPDRQGDNECEQTQFISPNNIDSTLPGYYLTTSLVKGQSNTIFAWYPNRLGRFQIYVYSPPNVIGATSVRYKIVTKNSDNDIYISESIEQTSPGWHQLLSKTGNTATDNWYFNKESRISLHLNTTESYRDNQWGNVGVNNSNANIDANHYVAVDAIKFVGGEAIINDNKSDITIISDCLNKKEINESDIIAKKIYRNYMEQSNNEIIIDEKNGISIKAVHESNNSKYYYKYFVISEDVFREEELFSINHENGAISERTNIFITAYRWFTSALNQLSKYVENLNDTYKQLFKNFLSGYFSNNKKSIWSKNNINNNDFLYPSVNATRAETLLLCMLGNNIEVQEGLQSSYSDVDQSNELYDIIETATKLGFVMMKIIILLVFLNQMIL